MAAASARLEPTVMQEVPATSPPRFVRLRQAAAAGEASALAELVMLAGSTSAYDRRLAMNATADAAAAIAAARSDASECVRWAALDAVARLGSDAECASLLRELPQQLAKRFLQRIRRARRHAAVDLALPPASAELSFSALVGDLPLVTVLCAASPGRLTSFLAMPGALEQLHHSTRQGCNNLIALGDRHPAVIAAALAAALAPASTQPSAAAGDSDELEAAAAAVLPRIVSRTPEAAFQVFSAWVRKLATSPLTARKLQGVYTAQMSTMVSLLRHRATALLTITLLKETAIDTAHFRSVLSSAFSGYRVAYGFVRAVRARAVVDMAAQGLFNNLHITATVVAALAHPHRVAFWLTQPPQSWRIVPESVVGGAEQAVVPAGLLAALPIGVRAEEARRALAATLAGSDTPLLAVEVSSHRWKYVACLPFKEAAEAAFQAARLAPADADVRLQASVAALKAAIVDPSAEAPAAATYVLARIGEREPSRVCLLETLKECRRWPSEAWPMTRQLMDAALGAADRSYATDAAVLEILGSVLKTGGRASEWAVQTLLELRGTAGLQYSRYWLQNALPRLPAAKRSRAPPALPTKAADAVQAIRTLAARWTPVKTRASVVDEIEAALKRYANNIPRLVRLALKIDSPLFDSDHPKPAADLARRRAIDAVSCIVTADPVRLSQLVPQLLDRHPGWLTHGVVRAWAMRHMPERALSIVMSALLGLAWRSELKAANDEPSRALVRFASVASTLRQRLRLDGDASITDAAGDGGDPAPWLPRTHQTRHVRDSGNSIGGRHDDDDGDDDDMVEEEEGEGEESNDSENEEHNTENTGSGDATDVESDGGDSGSDAKDDDGDDENNGSGETAMGDDDQADGLFAGRPTPARGSAENEETNDDADADEEGDFDERLPMAIELNLLSTWLPPPGDLALAALHWTPLQQKQLAAAILQWVTALDADAEGGFRHDRTTNVIHLLPMLRYLDPSPLLQIWADAAATAFQDPASAYKGARCLSALGQLDDAQGIEILLEAAAGPDRPRAKVALAALRRVCLSLPAVTALAYLRRVPLDGVSVSKAVVAVLDHLSQHSADVTAALLELAYMPRPQPMHPDLRKALLAAIWNRVDTAPSSLQAPLWSALAAAVTDGADRAPSALAAAQAVLDLPFASASRQARCRACGSIVTPLVSAPRADVSRLAVEVAGRLASADDPERVLRSALLAVVPKLPAAEAARLPAVVRVLYSLYGRQADDIAVLASSTAAFLARGARNRAWALAGEASTPQAALAMLSVLSERDAKLSGALQVRLAARVGLSELLLCLERLSDASPWSFIPVRDGHESSLRGDPDGLHAQVVDAAVAAVTCLPYAEAAKAVRALRAQRAPGLRRVALAALNHVVSVLRTMEADAWSQLLPAGTDGLTCRAALLHFCQDPAASVAVPAMALLDLDDQV